MQMYAGKECVWWVAKWQINLQKKRLWPLLNKKLRQAAVIQYCGPLSEETSYAVKKSGWLQLQNLGIFCSLIYSEHMVG